MKSVPAFILLAALFLLPASISRGEIQVELGFKGFIKPQVWFAVRTTGCETGTPIEVTIIQKEMYGRRKEQTHFRATGVFPAEPGRPAVVMCKQPQNCYGDVFLQVRAFHANGKIEKKEIKLKPIQSNDTVILTLSDTPHAFDFLGSIHLPSRGMMCVVPYGRENFPAARLELVVADIVLFDGVRDGLSAEQWNALEQWVTGGGTLIVTARGGAGGQQPGPGFSTLLKAVNASSGDAEMRESPALATLVGSIGKQLRRVAVPSLNVRERHRILEDGGRVLIAGEDIGAGRVLALGFDWQNVELADRAFVETFRQVVWLKLLGIDRKVNFVSPATSVVTPDEAKTRFLLGYIAAFLVAYVLVLGPVNWLVLRSMGKLEWSVITVPVGAVVFSVIAFAVGMALRTDKVLHREFSVVVAGKGYGCLRGTVGVLSPDRGSYAMTMASPSGLFEPEDRNPWNRNRRPRDLETYAFGGSCQVSNVKIGMWSMRYLMTEDVVPLGGELASAVSCGKDTVTGSITNGLPSGLKEAWVFAAGDRVRVGDIPAGASTNFVLKISGPSRADRGFCKNCKRYHGEVLPWGSAKDPGSPPVPPDMRDQLGALRSLVEVLSPKPVLVAWQEVKEPLVTLNRSETIRVSRRMMVLPMPILLEGPDLHVPAGIAHTLHGVDRPGLRDARFVEDIRSQPWTPPFRTERVRPGTGDGQEAMIGDPGVSMEVGVEEYRSARRGPIACYDYLLPFKGGDDVETLNLTVYWDSMEPDEDEKPGDSIIVAYDWQSTNWIELAHCGIGEKVLNVPDPGRFLNKSLALVRLNLVPASKPADEDRGFRHPLYLHVAYEGRRKNAQPKPEGP